jgi:Fur family transcriptional regulator, peroxide stress response regulator
MNQFVTEITRLGLKVTPQRLAILEFLEGNRTHPTVEDIYHEMSEKYPGLSHTTIYNILMKLIDAGKIREIHVDPQRRRFDPCMDPHDHFYCRKCGNIYNIDHDPHLSGIVTQERRMRDGHRIDTIEVSLQGICKYCEGGKDENDT